MPDSGFLAVFLVGLLGGVHCAGMCGGIVSALSPADARRCRTAPAWSIHLAYNLGRIASYAIAGALMGALGSLGLLLNKALPVQVGCTSLANLMMVALGLYLTGLTADTGFHRACRAIAVAAGATGDEALPAGARGGAGLSTRHALGLAALRPGV
jgi:sulfite exporter TauE/SafE